MYKIINPLFLLCESPLHAGSGDDLGIVDLPIQRERHTSFPKIESSSLKGALREAFETEVDSQKFNNWDDDDVKIHRFFGYDDGSLKSDGEDSPKRKLESKFKDASEYAGCLAFTDARTLLFPVKSMKGVFAWVTCQQVLNKFASDLAMAKNTSFTHLDAAIKAGNPSESHCLVSSNSVCINNNVVLEEYAFAATQNEDVKSFANELADTIFAGDSLAYWNGLLKTNLVVLSDADFRDFVNQSTEVITRTKIDNNTGTVQDGALFTEEYLPTDSVMYSLVMASKEYGKKASATNEQAMQFFKEILPPIFQLGGNATIGKGLLRTKLLN